MRTLQVRPGGPPPQGWVVCCHRAVLVRLSRQPYATLEAAEAARTRLLRDPGRCRACGQRFNRHTSGQG